jgi:NAD(P)-dependent dehydrogenase (short-subunit alcohol dehydrogenase family)
MMVEDADFVAELLQNVLELTQNQPLDFVLSAMPSTQFEVGKLQDAFKHIERAPYLNHASIVGVGEAPCSVPVLRKDTTKSLQSSIHPNGTYLLVGGLGGLGRSISELLVSNGATNLAFISRSGASSEQSKAFLKDLTERGVNTQVYCVDVCDLRLLQQLIHGPMAKDLPKIVGVFQCAAVIKDAVFDNMTYEDWVAATRPKITGSWNIVQAMDHLDPFFIFLASSAGVIGNRGQANYAAGNCFEDAIARSRRRRGKHAVSIDLGPVLGAGMLAEDEAILDMLRASGFYGIRHEDFLKVVTHAITMETLPGVPTPPQVTLGVGTGGLMLQNQPADPYWSRTALYSYLNLVDMPPPDLSLDSATSKMDMKAMLATCADTGSATDTVSTGLMHMLAKAMNMLFEEMDAGKPPNSYGVDSLVAVGVRNWVLSNTGVQVSVFEVLSDKTIAELAALVVEKGSFGAK